MNLHIAVAAALAVIAPVVVAQGVDSQGVAGISVPLLMALSKGDQIKMTIAGNAESFLVTRANRSPTGGEVEGHLTTDGRRQMHVGWEGASITGLFQSADGALLAVGAGDGQSKPLVEVAAPAKARAAEPLDPNQSFTGPSAQLFRATITSLSAPIGQVVNDRAVAVQARCGTPATLREIRQFIQSPLGAQAISIATNEGAETDNCRNDTSPGCAATAAYRADYLASIADITCASQ